MILRNFHNFNKNSIPFQHYMAFFATFLFIFIFSNTIYAQNLHSGIINSDEFWHSDDGSVVIDGDLLIAANTTLTVDPGVDIKIKEGVVITVLGRFDLNGEVEHPIKIDSYNDQRWGAISFEENGSGLLKHCYINHGSQASGNRVGMINAYRCTSSVIIDSCTFTDWPDDFGAKATQAYHSPKMEIRRCLFGPGENEAIHGSNSAVLIEYNTFEQRYGYSDAVDIGDTQNPGPIIRYNVFLGSEDDGIDLDTCDAYVEGNLVMNCRGGNHDPIGISGDKDANPIIVNNVIINCENGIGFKNGADITVINNTIINCDRGVWLHQDAAHARMINTIIWGRDDQISIKLEPGSTIDASYSIMKGESIYPGTGNQNADPMLVNPLENMFELLPGSPAIDAGWGEEAVLDYDFSGNSRFDALEAVNTTSSNPAYIDIGAFEYQAAITHIKKWMMF